MKTSLIIVAAGKGERFGRPKADVLLAGKTLLDRCLETIQQLPFENEVIVVASEEGGKTRFESVKIGLKKCKADLVLIHNVANPFATVEDFISVREELLKQDAAVFVGQKNADTLRRVDRDASSTIARENIWRVQTPQGFRRATLSKLIEEFDDPSVTDEVMLYERNHLPVVALLTSPQNFKITYPEDLELAERILAGEVRTGIGEDSHAFDSGGELTLAGVKIPAVPKLKGNSDGDLVLHALFNAISSALGKGSLGPTGDPMAEQGIVDSKEYLSVILNETREQGWWVSNVSVSLECSRPKIEPIADQLKNSLSQLLEVTPQQIGLTATSGEELTSFGRGEGIRCSCLVTLKRPH